MRKSKNTILGLLSIFTGIVLTSFAATPALASPNPATQGGASGVIYFTEAQGGSPGIYIGDFSSAAKTAYWIRSGSRVDLLATTERKVAWGSSQPSLASNIAGTVMIADVGLVASNPITVTIPPGANPTILRSIASDPFGEKFYITTTEGDIWSLTSDGQNLTKVFDSTTDATVKTAVSNIYYGSWFDPYNSNFYFCSYSNERTPSNPHIRTIMKASVTGSSMSLPAPVLDSSSQPIQVYDCDGVGVNPATQEIIALKATGPYLAPYANDIYNWSRISSAGVKTDITNFKLTDGTDIDRTTYGGGNAQYVAPSSMFISHSTSKMYFSTEKAVFETDYDGNNTRALYAGGTSIQSIAVYYGATVSTIDNVVQNLSQQNGTPSGSSTASQNLANTGMNNSLFIASGALGMSLIILGSVMIYARRMQSNQNS